jgi:hypothetical protein
VHPIDGVDRILLQNRLFDHQTSAPFIFLGRLKDEMDRPGEISRLRQVFGRSQQHCRMAVMTAGMHAARIVRDMREIILFRDMQSIHVGTQCHRTAARHRSLQGADHPRSRDTAFDRDAEGFEELRNQLRSLVLFERGFRMGMNPLPPLGHLRVKIGDPVDDRHRSDPC